MRRTGLLLPAQAGADGSADSRTGTEHARLSGPGRRHANIRVDVRTSDHVTGADLLRGREPALGDHLVDPNVRDTEDGGSLAGADELWQGDEAPAGVELGLEHDL